MQGAKECLIIIKAPSGHHEFQADTRKNTILHQGQGGLGVNATIRYQIQNLIGCMLIPKLWPTYARYSIRISQVCRDTYNRKLQRLCGM
jgi:hypothetical protein